MYGSEDKLGVLMGYQEGKHFYSIMTRPGTVGSYTGEVLTGLNITGMTEKVNLSLV